jgi:hypothetical protein
MATTEQSRPASQKLPAGLAGVLNPSDDNRDSAYYSSTDASSKRESSPRGGSGAFAQLTRELTSSPCIGRHFSRIIPCCQCLQPYEWWLPPIAKRQDALAHHHQPASAAADIARHQQHECCVNRFSDQPCGPRRTVCGPPPFHRLCTQQRYTGCRCGRAHVQARERRQPHEPGLWRNEAWRVPLC